MTDLKQQIASILGCMGDWCWPCPHSIQADKLAALFAAQPASMAPATDDWQNLLPCPCCGGKAELQETDDEANYIECGVCKLTTNLQYSSKDDARPLLAERWNRRALAAGSQASGDAGYVECPGCSEAGGADRPVYHKPPICGSQASPAQADLVTQTLEWCAEAIEHGAKHDNLIELYRAAHPAPAGTLLDEMKANLRANVAAKRGATLSCGCDVGVCICDFEKD